jgi:hypothetical protein
VTAGKATGETRWRSARTSADSRREKRREVPGRRPAQANSSNSADSRREKNDEANGGSEQVHWSGVFFFFLLWSTVLGSMVSLKGFISIKNFFRLSISV